MFKQALPTKSALSILAFCNLYAGAELISVPSDYSDVQAAVDAAAVGDEIVVSPGEYVGNIRIDKAVTVRSLEGAETTTLTGNGSGPAVMIESESDSGGALMGFTITGGVGQNGGGLFLSGDVAVIDCTVSGNTAQNGGGAFLVGTPMLSDVRFRGNVADQGGGVFLSPDAVPLMDLCDFYENAADTGGAVYISPRSLQTTYATIGAAFFERNSAQNGAGIYAAMGGFEVADSTFYENDASELGGAVFMLDGEFSSFTNSSLSNGESDEGAAMYLSGEGEVRVQECEVHENISRDSSAAITVESEFQLAMMNSLLWLNTSESIEGPWEDLGGNEFSLPRLCEIDYAVPLGIIDIQDLLRFVTLFLSNDPEADLVAPEGMHDLSDLQAFIDMYFSGCGTSTI